VKSATSVGVHPLSEYRECLEACLDDADLTEYMSKGYTQGQQQRQQQQQQHSSSGTPQGQPEHFVGYRNSSYGSTGSFSSNSSSVAHMVPDWLKERRRNQREEV
jgi:hypothetical protein